MEKETCAFEKWLEALQKGTEEEDLIPILGQIASAVFKRYGVRVWFSEILGKRWSHIAGEGGDTPLSLTQFVLSPRLGMTAEGWNRIPKKEGEALLSFLRNLVQQRATSSKNES